MKAAVLHANDDIRYEDFPTPEPKDDELLVRVDAIGICGSDVPRVLGGAAHYYPIVLGHEFCGEVVKTGSNVKNFSIGDRMTGVPLLPCMECFDCKKGNYSLCKNYKFIGSSVPGAFAEYIALPEKNAVKIEKSVTREQGAMFEPATVALHGVFCNDFQPDGSVLVLGGGTVGMFTAQWTKLLGAKSVTVADIADERLTIAKKLGIDHTINTLNEKITEKYDYVFETAGQTVTMLMAFDAAANKAHVCFIGTPHKDLTFTPAQWENINRKEFRLTGSWMSYSADFPGREWEMTAKYYATGELKCDPSFVFRSLPLSRAQEAFDLFKNPAQVKGKVLLINE